MANLACYVCGHINGVAKIHSAIIAKNTLSQWYQLYPERFSNKTNGITFRRWLAISNDELYKYLCKLLKTDVVKEPSALSRLSEFCENDEVLEGLYEIRRSNKKRLCAYIRKNEHVSLNDESIFFIQIKRIHEYKRQLLNAFSILYIYFGIKDGSIKNISPVTFIFGAKSAPGYRRAKAIIKYINEIAEIISSDNEVNKLINVVFVSNYNVSYAEKLVAAESR